MSTPVETVFTNPDPDSPPLASLQQLIDLLNTLVTSQINQTFVPFVVGASVPGVDQQGLPWIRLNTLGNPVGTYIFTQGVWVREEPIVSARFGMFTGDPALYFDGDGVGIKGPGPIAMDYWGWALMNGNGGRQNWSNRFLIGGAMDNDGISGFDGSWRTNVNGAAEEEGGVAEITLDADTSYTGIDVGLHDATGSAGGGGPLYGTGTGTTIGETEPSPISVVNPFRAVAFIQFIGYTST